MVRNVVHLAKFTFYRKTSTDNLADEVTVLHAEKWFCRQQKPDEHFVFQISFVFQIITILKGTASRPINVKQHIAHLQQQK